MKKVFRLIQINHKTGETFRLHGNLEELSSFLGYNTAFKRINSLLKEINEKDPNLTTKVL